METLKVLALGAAVALPLAALLIMLLGYMIRTQHKWRKLPPSPATPPLASAVHEPKFSK